ncbi:MAG: efflux RND transporter periplasmic adaptor subunit [Burkholderiales bacterium]
MLAVAVAVVWWQRARGPLVHVETVRRADITQTVVSTGRVITPARVELGSVITGTVTELLVREGDPVKAGQVLARLRADEPRAAVAQAEAALAEAEARLAQLGTLAGPVAENALERAAQNLRLAREEHLRVERLHRQGFFSTSRLDEALRNLRVAESDHASALAQATANRPRGSEHALARARREQAHAALALAKARLEYTEIRASADGTLLRKFVEPGDTVQPGKPLFELTVAGETQVLLQVDEKNLGLLAAGQRAKVAADAYPDRPADAAIFYIAPSVDATRGTVEVKLRVPDPGTFLKPDMTVSAEILSGSKKGALALSSAAVRDAAGARPWVLAVRDGRAARVDIKLGLRGEGVVEVQDGLAEGELVVPVGAPVRPGARLRADAAPPPAKEKTGTLDVVR